MNLRVLGKANVALLSNETVLSAISPAIVARVNLQMLFFAVLAALHWT